QDGAGAPLIRTLRAGEGFLAQSTKRLVIGFGTATEVERVVVRWPGGRAEEFSGVLADHRYVLAQGAGSAVEDPPRAVATLAAGARALPAESSASRVPLVVLLDVPRLAYSGSGGEARALETGKGRAVLVVLWASWCAPCLEELKEITTRAGELRAAGIDVTALSVDGLGDDRSDPTHAREIIARLASPSPAARPGGGTTPPPRRPPAVPTPPRKPLP